MTENGPTIRKAAEADVQAIAAIFAKDTLGGHGDTDDPAALPDYIAAFRTIADSANQDLYVVTEDGEVVATFQTMITTTMPGRGSSSMIIEAVQTRPDRRGRGIGKLMIEFCIADARDRGMRMVQLTSNAVRKDAHRFYQRLGFQPTHLGFKIKLK
ncbi:GNAT family N-acetyltransferase [Rhizobium halophytocola]|uniref:GNAT superfamily N-acetyltransferase n=1 Tax=Rhizobium halophytocola TaxID=735519 RepID=A0ABS4DXZ1_9HYPH|nr:GNAT family N-acetyltransferase [Rhizobium halophytocola]MBP1850567.1 GNAT superfamily N-acetyltransferase [Rhizobium halophytocola]